MDYNRIYNSIIQNRRNNPISKEEYGENHHIIPKCMGGNNSKENIVRLTAREHFICHWLLYKIYRTSSLACAFYNMTRNNKNGRPRYVSRSYMYAKKARALELSKSSRGENNHFYGKKHTQETKDKISKLKKGNKNWITRGEESRQRYLEAVRRPKSEEHRRKIGRKGFIMLKNINTGESIKIKREERPKYDCSVWVNPSLTQEKQQCIYCGKITYAGTIKRWHNERCKERKK